MEGERQMEIRRSMRIRKQQQEIFPEDIMICILTRLPVKSIIRFKSVCKPWVELLSSPDFRKLHHGQYSMDPRNQTYIIQRFNVQSSNTLSLFKIGINQKKHTILNHPFSHEKIMIRVVGCCNGLVCLIKSPFNNVIHLWNPSLNMYKEIFPLEERVLNERVSLGFGYDAVGDDFKVVQIVYLENMMDDFGMTVDKVEVYSVRSDSWTSIQIDIPFRILQNVNDVDVNGTPYWIACVHGMPALVYLDLSKLVLKFVPVIQLIECDRIYFDYNGCLGALLFTVNSWSERIIESHIEVWVYDADDNFWTKNRTLDPLEVKLSHIFAWTKNGKIIGKRPDGKLCVCNPETGRVEESFYCTRQGQCFGLSEYTENLTHIDGMKQLKAKRTKKMAVN